MKIKHLILVITVFLVGTIVACDNTTVQKQKDVDVLNQKVNTQALDQNAKRLNNGVKEDESGESLKIVAVGDILLGRGVGARLDRGNKGYIYPFEKVEGFLKAGDIVFGNLEESITDSNISLAGINNGGKYVLKNKVAAFEGIKYAHFNLLSLANNHIMDYYQKGLYDTIKILDKNNIAHGGAGSNLEEARKMAIVNKKGIKIGMLSYTDMADIVYKGNPPLSFAAGKTKSGVSPLIAENIIEDVRKARSEVDFLIVSFHWGIEESFEVSPQQQKLAHQLIDQGVDIILGHHPHQFQGIEMYKNKPIVYSLGNFIFDQNEPENQEGFILNMEYDKNSLTKLYAIPIRVINKTQVVPLDEASGKQLLQRESKLSMTLGTKCRTQSNKLFFEVK